MLEDYTLFEDLVVFDTAHRTNKYSLICEPFVGMNHHAMNAIFGSVFLMNERIASFVWLLNTFLNSTGCKHAMTVMIDQAFSMAAAIKMVFPLARYRLLVYY